MGNLSGVFDRLPPSLPPEEQLRAAIRAAGLRPPDKIMLDGKLHRFRSGEKPDKSGWYVAFGDAIPAGAFGCWRAGITETWIAETTTAFAGDLLQARERIAEAIARREAEAEQDYALAAEVVREIWNSCALAPADHPYLQRKRIQPHGARVTSDGRLVLPLYDAATGDLSSLQYISADGTKRFHAGARAKNCLWAIGDLAQADTVFIAEGFATAATIAEVAGKPCAIAYSASNLPATAQAARRIAPSARVVVVADNDAHGVGARYAGEAKDLTGAEVVVIPTPRQDANDYALAGGDLRALLLPPVQAPWSYSFAEFARQPELVPWLVKRWLRPETLVLLVGPSGAGKSFLAIDWAASVVTGRQWFGYRVNQAQVFYVAGEGHYGLRARLAAWQQYHRIDPEGDAWARHGRITASGCDLNTPGGVERVLRELDATKLTPKLIFVDTLHRAFRGDENSAEDVRSMLTACESLIKRTRAAVVLVHHTGWGEDAQRRGRGSSAWRGAADSEILLLPVKGDEQKTCEISQVKVKDAREVPSIFARPETVILDGWLDEDGDSVESAVLVQVQQQPKRNEKDQRLDQHRQTLEAAWWLTGENVRDGAPFVPRDALRQYLIEHRRVSPESADVYLRASAKGKLIAELLGAKVIEAIDGGWKIVDPALASSLLLRRTGDRNAE